VNGFDLADGQRGIFASAQPGRSALAFEGDRLLADAQLDVELSEVGVPVRLEGETTGVTTLTVCRALGTVRHAGGKEEIASLAVRNDQDSPTLSGAARRRSIAVVFADGGLLAIEAVRPEGAEDHAAEEVRAALAEPSGEQTNFEEALLSTEFDEGGRHRRATLELTPAGDAYGAPMRGAGTVVCGTSVEADGLRREVAFFRWGLGGRPGLGRYEIVTPL
jgi:hypothetical protein